MVTGNQRKVNAFGSGSVAAARLSTGFSPPPLAAPQATNQELTRSAPALKQSELIRDRFAFEPIELQEVVMKIILDKKSIRLSEQCVRRLAAEWRWHFLGRILGHPAADR